MRVGIDGRVLGKERTGIGRYTFELTKALINYKHNNYRVYSPSLIDDEMRAELNTANITSFLASSRFLKMVWSQTLLPYLATKDNIDLFWGPTHRLPRFLPKSIARVVTIHDLVWKFAPQTMRPPSLFFESRLMPEAISLTDLVLADSQSTASGIAEVFPQFSHKIRIVKLGTSILPNPPGLGFLKKCNVTKPYFLFVGTIEPRKNLERLLKAFALVPEYLKKKFSLVIAGGKGWGGVNLEKLVSEQRLTDSVKMLGYVNDHELAALYSNARFLVMPSIYEGFGLPVLEAMQYGKPILTSHESSMAEIVGGGGVFIDPYSEESISVGIQKMLVDDALIESLGNLARNHSQEFSWEKCAAETMEVFEEAMTLRDIRMSRS